jgi:inorganic phosphate transporter, PiT family
MFFGLDIGIFALLIGCLALVCIFEFVNGSHDTANAVSPVIYSHSLKPKVAVILAACMNFLGVTLWGIAVAMGIIHLLPLEVIASQGNMFGICVVLSLLITAIIWNAGTWYLGLPASSSHTLIGSIFGVGIAMSILPIGASQSVSLNWHKIIEVIESLLLSPVIGFWLAFTIMSISYIYFSRKYKIFSKPKKKEVPELWLRSLLVAASAWVSFAHGSNDGQKWVGLVMLILISLVPTTFALNPDIEITTLQGDVTYIQEQLWISPETQKYIPESFQRSIENLSHSLFASQIEPHLIRSELLVFQREWKALENSPSIISQVQATPVETVLQDPQMQEHIEHLYKSIDYAPWWVIALISVSLGIGTMFGWKRIVKTLGKKIGNHKLSYAESTSSALITALTITVASRFGLPVSTTHIFSSSIAGCMMTGKKPGLQHDTVKHIVLAWVLTLPITICFSALLFSFFWVVFL